jgi:hypothetical protein
VKGPGRRLLARGIGGLELGKLSRQKQGYALSISLESVRAGRRRVLGVYNSRVVYTTCINPWVGHESQTSKVKLEIHILHVCRRVIPAGFHTTSSYFPALMSSRHSASGTCAAASLYVLNIPL